jgi:hypothetical protein
MRVLVTGASGLLGRAVVTEFKNSGHEGWNEHLEPWFAAIVFRSDQTDACLRQLA